MIELTKSICYHIPKTGGSFVHTALSKMCEVVSEHKCHAGIDEYPSNGKFSFTFIRHPVAMYESSYHYHRKMHAPGTVIEWVLNRHTELPFKEYIEKITSIYPGWLSGQINRCCKRMDFIGKQENLKEDLIEALNLAQEPYWTFTIDDIPRENVGGYKESLVTDYERQLIETSEKEMIERFYGIR